MLCPKWMIVHANGRYHVLKGLQQLKRSFSIKSAAANKVTGKYKKLCQMLQLLKQNKKKVPKNLASAICISPNFQFFLL